MPEDWCQRTDARGLMPEDWCQRTDARGLMPEDGCQRTDARGRMPEDRCQKKGCQRTYVIGQMPEDWCQMMDARGLMPEDWCQRTDFYQNILWLFEFNFIFDKEKGKILAIMALKLVCCTLHFSKPSNSFACNFYIAGTLRKPEWSRRLLLWRQMLGIHLMYPWMYPTSRNDGRCFCCKTRNNGNSFFLFPSFLAWLLLSTCTQWEFFLLYSPFRV
jgi:hypothetical protein